jgi:hypothetical protein
MERVSVDVGHDGVFADSDLLTPESVHAHFRVRCDGQWRTRHVEVAVVETPPRVLRLESDGEGRWAGRPELDGCIDVDISTTPLTNTLPVRRLRLAPGASAEIRVGYVDVPALTISAVSQRYTRIDGRTYRYASGSFAADVVVDEHDLVTDYEGLWRRVPIDARS